VSAPAHTPEIASPARARSLLARASAAFDVDARLERDARALAAAGFGGGLAWMQRRVRGRGVPSIRGHAHGLVKYGLCVAFAVVVSAACLGAGVALEAASVAVPLAALVFVPAFYALESRWVFVFPALAHGERHPFRRSWALTGEHGGTLGAMSVVIPIAAHMLLHGLRDGRPLRAWAVGCHAVLLWYEDLAR
jgi:hypothetical protein